MSSNQQEELEIIKQVFEYCESGSTHLQPDTLLNPVDHYADAAQLEKEISILFRDFPIIVAHVKQLKERGQFVTHNDTGVPLLVTRNREGEIKAFINVCRHRGAKVESAPCGKANTFSCPYHSWTYDLDGRLRGLPHAATFGDIDKSNYGLVEVPAFERFGLIWVRPRKKNEKQNGDSLLNIDSWLAPMADQLGDLDLASHSIYKTWSVNRNMSWRIALEGFQESYHFCSAHKNTACSTYLDNQSVFIDKYPHIRHAVPLARIQSLASEAADAKDYRPNFMDQNYLFPCNFLQVMTDHVYVHSIIPTGQDTCVFKCMMLIPEAATTDKAQRYWQANYDVVRAVFDEDFEIGEGIQAGFATDVNQNFTFGRYEAGLHLGQKAIDDALNGRLRFETDD